MARFPETYCSQCGGQFGPGDHGYSHCENHAGLFNFDDDDGPGYAAPCGRRFDTLGQLHRHIDRDHCRDCDAARPEDDDARIERQREHRRREKP
jgi:hypothetical protein